MSIRVVIVDDNPAVRLSLARGFAAQADINLVGEAADGERALALLRDIETDVIVMDEHMPRLSGLAVVAALRHDGIDTPVLILTADPRVASRAAVLDHVEVLVKGDAGLGETLSAVRLAAGA